MNNYAELMFTDAVRALQDGAGTREKYERLYPHRTKETLGEDEKAFLETRSTIYIATVSETGWPYIQHRGGPTGFLKVLGPTKLGFADYRGNQQFISQGNLQGETRLSLFAMDYARKARLKVQGHAQMVMASDDPDLAAKLATDGEGPVERLMTIDVVAVDWNCPQYITQRFDANEMAQVLAPQITKLTDRIDLLEQEIARLDPASPLLGQTEK